MDFELVFPCYNEAPVLALLLQKTILAAKENGLEQGSFQILVVNNGSTDSSRQVLVKLKSSPLGPFFRIVDIDVNKGYGFGLWEGLKQTTAPWVGFSHADLQCDPGDLFRALRIAKKAGPQTIVKGHRLGRDRKSQWVSDVFAFVARWVLRQPLYEINAQPKVFSRELMKRIPDPPHGYGFDLYLLFRALRNGFVVKTIDVDLRPRGHGFSTWSATLLGRYRTILDMLRYTLEIGNQIHGKKPSKE